MGELRIVECNRCGHKWPTRLGHEPKCCAKCVSPYWNRARVRVTKRLADKMLGGGNGVVPG